MLYPGPVDTLIIEKLLKELELKLDIDMYQRVML